MLDFLAKATISDVAEGAVRKSGPRKERNPEGLAIRIFRDGSVYPSTALISTFNLEYKNAVKETKDVKQEDGSMKAVSAWKVEGDAGNGFDVIDTKHYPSFQLPAGQRILLISPVVRTEGKVDLFGSTTYNDDGTPKSSVIDQGSTTFGTDNLIPMLEAVYGVKFRRKIDYGADGRPEGAPEFSEGVEYADLVLVANPATNQPWTLPANKEVTYIPKRITRGKDAGAFSTIRREKPVFYALIPATILEQSNEPQQTAPATALMA